MPLLTASSGKTCIHHMSIDSFPQSIVVSACIKQTEIPHPHPENCLDKSGLLLQKCNHLFGIHFNVHWCIFRCLAVLQSSIPLI